MAKKIKKRPKTSETIEDPNLDEVGEDRSFEMELDEETNEIVFVCHYRHKWGDELDGDVEHIFNMEEAMNIVSWLTDAITSVRNRLMIEKATMVPIEGNPMQGPRIADIPEENK
jgi:hypothetical protein